MKNSMPPFEECLAFVKYAMGTQLLDWQVEVLRGVYEHRGVYYYPYRDCGKGSGRDTVMHALQILEAIETDRSLCKDMKKENSQ